VAGPVKDAVNKDLFVSMSALVYVCCASASVAPEGRNLSLFFFFSGKKGGRACLKIGQLEGCASLEIDN